jgi:hypothetical protein
MKPLLMASQNTGSVREKTHMPLYRFFFEIKFRACVTSSGRPARIRYATGKINWDPAAALRGHREPTIVWQHYHQEAAPHIPPEVG